MSRNTPKTIELRAEGIQHERRRAVADITPGMLLKISSDADTVAPHSLDGGTLQAAFANEYWPTGKTIDDVYLASHQVIYTVYPDGSHIYALLKEGQNVSHGERLTSNGDGTLRSAVAGDTVLGWAIEAVNAASADSRIRVEVGVSCWPGSSTVLSGEGEPDAGLGDDGDFYIDTDTLEIYGPKDSGAWGELQHLTGNELLSGEGVPAGSTGRAGDFYIDTEVPAIYGPKVGEETWGSATVLPGVDGNTVLSGEGAPAGGVGSPDDFYIDTDVPAIYGPKVGEETWGSAVSLVGPTGVSSLALHVEHAQKTEDATKHMMVVPVDKQLRLIGASYYNPTGLLEDATNYFEIIVQQSDTPDIPLASWSTQDDGAAEGTIPAAEAIELTVATEAEDWIAAGEVIELFLAETETATLPAGELTAIFEIRDAE